MPASDHAVAQIRAELAADQRRRSLVFALYLALFALVVIGLLLAPIKPDALPRNLSWMSTLSGLVLASVLATSAAIGVPLWRERSIVLVTALCGLILGGSLAWVIDWRAPITIATRCFAFGTFVSSIALITLGVLGGRTWRRFPEPGLLLAISVTAVGLIALHAHCPGVDALHIYAFHLGPVIVSYALARAALRTRGRLLREL